MVKPRLTLAFQLILSICFFTGLMSSHCQDLSYQFFIIKNWSLKKTKKHMHCMGAKIEIILPPSRSKIVWDTWRFLPPYLVGSGGGLGGNRTVTRRQSGVSNRLQRALHRVSRATTPTPLSFPPTFWNRTNTVKYRNKVYGTREIHAWVIVQLQDPYSPLHLPTF